MIINEIVIKFENLCDLYQTFLHTNLNLDVIQFMHINNRLHTSVLKIFPEPYIALQVKNLIVHDLGQISYRFSMILSYFFNNVILLHLVHPIIPVHSVPNNLDVFLKISYI